MFSCPDLTSLGAALFGLRGVIADVKSDIKYERPFSYIHLGMKKKIHTPPTRVELVTTQFIARYDITQFIARYDTSTPWRGILVVIG